METWEKRSTFLNKLEARWILTIENGYNFILFI